MSDPFSTQGKVRVRRLIETMKTKPLPIVMPRWMLYLFYLMFALLGVTLATFGSVSVRDSTPAGYVLPYGVAIFITAIGGAIGAYLTRHEGEPALRKIAVELWFVVLLFSLLSVYVAASVGPWVQGDIGKGTLAVVVTIASLIPFTRTVELSSTIITTLAVRAKTRQQDPA